MKSLYIEKYDAFVRYFDIPASDPKKTTPRIYISGLSTPATAGLLSLATHPLVRGERTLLIDYFGSGFSDNPSDFDHTMPSLAELVVAVIEHEKLSSVDIIGHSMGGTIAFYVAMQKPALVRRIICAEGNLFAGGGPGTRRIASFNYNDWMTIEHQAHMDKLTKRAREGHADAAFVEGAWRSSDARGIYLQSQSLVNLPDDFPEQLVALNKNVPITFVYGEHNLPENNDGAIFPDSPETTWLTERGIAYDVVPNSGHMMMVDNLDGFAQVVAKALR
ncbi:MAG: alpha/beta hydrolase [Chloroflexota bacterium]